jgi:hypothetical protein
MPNILLRGENAKQRILFPFELVDDVNGLKFNFLIHYRNGLQKQDRALILKTSICQTYQRETLCSSKTIKEDQKISENHFFEPMEF